MIAAIPKALRNSRRNAGRVGFSRLSSVGSPTDRAPRARTLAGRRLLRNTARLIATFRLGDRTRSRQLARERVAVQWPLASVACWKKLTAAEPRSTIVATRSQKVRPTMRATLAEAKADLRAIEKELGAR